MWRPGDTLPLGSSPSRASTGLDKSLSAWGFYCMFLKVLEGLIPNQLCQLPDFYL